MIRPIHFFSFLLIFFSCATESSKPKTVFPDQLQSSRTPKSILLSWQSPLILMEVDPEFYERTATPESFELYVSKGDTLNFEIVGKTSGEKRMVYGENQKGIDYFFKLKCIAKKATPAFSNIIWLNGGSNPELNLIRDFQQRYSRLADVSHDETKLLYDGNSENNNQGIFLFDLKLQEEELILQNVESPAFSSDGKKIAFTSYFGNYTQNPDGRNLGIIDMNTGSIDTVTAGGYAVYSPYFTNENSQLFFHNSPYNQKDQILSLNLSDGSIDTLYTAEENISFQRISFDRENKRFFMTLFHNNTSKKFISVFDVASKQTSEFLDGNIWRESYPSISPDGKLLAFYAQRSGRDEIWILNLENGESIQLTGNTDIYFRGDIVWSPTHSRIYVRGNTDEGYAFYSIDVGI